MGLKMAPGAWALLSFLRRASEGGPAAPKGFVLEYAELHENGLVVRVGSKLVITEKGKAALLERNRDD